MFEDRYVRLNGHERAWYLVMRVRLSTEETITILTNLLWVRLRRFVCSIATGGRSRSFSGGSKICCSWIILVSRDPTGIIRQVVVALVVWGLLMIYGADEGQGLSPKQLWRELQAAMHQAIFDFGRRCSGEGILPDRYSLEELHTVGIEPKEQECVEGCAKSSSLLKSN